MCLVKQRKCGAGEGRGERKMFVNNEPEQIFSYNVLRLNKISYI